MEAALAADLITSLDFVISREAMLAVDFPSIVGVGPASRHTQKSKPESNSVHIWQSMALGAIIEKEKHEIRPCQNPTGGTGQLAASHAMEASPAADMRPTGPRKGARDAYKNVDTACPW